MIKILYFYDLWFVRVLNLNNHLTKFQLVSKMTDEKSKNNIMRTDHAIEETAGHVSEFENLKCIGLLRTRPITYFFP